LVQAVPRDVSSNQSGVIYAQGYQVKNIKAAKINVSWLRASLNAIHKRNETGKK
ncbi:hypothetical protein Tco_0125509, partial [Tanacetum coccineum]